MRSAAIDKRYLPAEIGDPPVDDGIFTFGCGGWSGFADEASAPGVRFLNLLGQAPRGVVVAGGRVALGARLLVGPIE